MTTTYAPPYHDSARHRLASGAAYARAGAAFGLAAALAGVVLVLEVALAVAPPAAALSVGRLHAAYVVLALYGGVSLPLAGFLLEASVAGRGVAGRRAAAALVLWSAGVVISTVAVLAGAMAPGGWVPAPWWAQLPIWLAAALWAVEVWSGLAARRDGWPVWATLAVAGATALLVYGALGAIAAFRPFTSGAALIGATHAHGYRAMWIGLAGLAVAAALLPSRTGRPLFGRRLVWLALVVLLPLQSLAGPVVLRPDLVPTWMVRPLDVVAVLLIVPAVALAATMAGVLVARPASLPVHPEARFALAGALALCAGMAWQAALVPGARSIVQFTAWEAGDALLPPLTAMWLLAAGASYAMWRPGEGSRHRVDPRWHLLLAIAAGGLLWLPLAPVGMAQAAVGAEGAVLVLWGRISVPGALALLASGAVWLANGIVGGTRPSDPRSWPVGRPGPPTAPIIAGLTVTTLAAAFFVSLFLPLADPSLRTPSALAEARALDPNSISAAGRDVYVAEGCVTCHTQRVRALPADSRYGPTMGPGDLGEGAALAGALRAGPDLTWVGDRHATREAMLEALTPHEPNGDVPYPWLLGEAGPSADGGALLDYLLGLRSGDIAP